MEGRVEDWLWFWLSQAENAASAAAELMKTRATLVERRSPFISVGEGGELEALLRRCKPGWLSDSSAISGGILLPAMAFDTF